MAFTILVNSTPADASDVNADFYHVAQGSRLPMGGTSLEATTNVYDLGSSIASWNNLFCQNIYIGSTITTVDKSLWTLISEIELSSPAASIEFTGLNGDSQLEYRIITMMPRLGTTTALALKTEMFLNNDSGTNYGVQNIQGADTVVSANRYTSITSMYFDTLQVNASYTSYYFYNSILYPRTGFVRMMLTNSIELARTNNIIGYVKDYAHVWNNTTDTISSIKFDLLASASSSNFNTGTHIQLWARS